MGFRTVFIKDGEKISLKLDNLVVHKDNEQFSIPIEDLQSIILEGHDTVITTRLLARLSKHHVSVIICDYQHMPTGLFLELGQYHRSAKRIQQQAKWEKETKEELWKEIIKMKIFNQLQVVQILTDDIERIEKIALLYPRVAPGDATNREGHAAKLYFNALFGVDFSREGPFIENAYMDYGYAIVRSQIAKEISANGLHPSIGIFHKSEYNSYNLADDLMEPFRPIMDYYILTEINDKNVYLSYEKRLKLIDFLNQPIFVSKKTYPMYATMALFVKSCIKVLEENDMSYLEEININNYMGDK